MDEWTDGWMEAFTISPSLFLIRPVARQDSLPDIAHFVSGKF